MLDRVCLYVRHGAEVIPYAVDYPAAQPLHLLALRYGRGLIHVGYVVSLGVTAERLSASDPAEGVDHTVVRLSRKAWVLSQRRLLRVQSLNLERYGYVLLLLRQLDRHPDIVEVVDVCVQSHGVRQVSLSKLEYLSGRLAALLSALSCAHSKGVVDHWLTGHQ